MFLCTIDIPPYSEGWQDCTRSVFSLEISLLLKVRKISFLSYYPRLSTFSLYRESSLNLISLKGIEESMLISRYPHFIIAHKDKDVMLLFIPMHLTIHFLSSILWDLCGKEALFVGDILFSGRWNYILSYQKYRNSTFINKKSCVIETRY